MEGGISFTKMFFSLGFRPFFLAAGLFSILAMAMWLALIGGWTGLTPDMPPTYWHAHEMLFGYAGAAVAGFFLTAVPNWTGAPPVAGNRLAALFLLWLAGRICLWLVPALPAVAATVLDVAFFPALAMLLLPALRQGGSRRSFIFPPILGTMALGNLLFHLEWLGVADETAGRGLILMVDCMVLLIGIIGGRVTPSFTGNVLQAKGEAAQVRSFPLLDRLALGSLLALLVTDLVLGSGPEAGVLAGVMALVAAALNGARLCFWQGVKTLKEPLLLVLHLGYGWLVVGLTLKGLAGLGDLTGLGDFLSPADAVHGITVGAIGTMTLALMSRASLGHTGRPLRAGRILPVAFAMVSLAALARIGTSFLTPLLGGDAFDAVLWLSGGLWITAFGLFSILFLPVFMQPRGVAGQG